MKKGDCIILQNSDAYFAIILHHSNFKNGELFHGFVVVGEQYLGAPTFNEIKSSKILGFKFVNKTSDLINSMAWISKEQKPSEIYNGVDMTYLLYQMFYLLKKRIEFR